ncbi:MAG TPA: PspC domain-containing protein [Gemmatales bacterium]|nr:PspC domain-containing protein [Gemmatales bacterium]
MSMADELAKLERLRESGALTEAEFRQAKARILGAGEPDGGPHSYGSPATGLHRLSRSRTDAMLGGVCGGLARWTDLPSWVWRLIFCFGFLAAGTGLLLYVLLWIFMPLED